MTSSKVPVQNVDVSDENKNEVTEQSEVKEQPNDPSNKNSQQFEDNRGDLSEDASKGDGSVSPDNNSNGPKKQEEKLDGKLEEKSAEDTQTENKDSNVSEKKSDSDENEKSNSDVNEKKSDSDENEKRFGSNENEKRSDSDEEKKSDSDVNEKKYDSDDTQKKSDDASETTDKTEETVEQSGNKESDENSNEKKTDDNANNQVTNEVYPSGAQSELLNESTAQNGSWSTQAVESKNEKESQVSSQQSTAYNWKLCNVTAGPDFIPCLDNLKAIKNLPSTKHYEHRERQCPKEPPTCLVPLPEGYQRPIEWPKSREKVDIKLNGLLLSFFV